jgi:hypothetical protein
MAEQILLFFFARALGQFLLRGRYLRVLLRFLN